MSARGNVGQTDRERMCEEWEMVLTDWEAAVRAVKSNCHVSTKWHCCINDTLLAVLTACHSTSSVMSSMSPDRPHMTLATVQYVYCVLYCYWDTYHQLFMNYQCEPTWPSTTFNVLQIEYTREISCHAWLACTITSFIGDSRVTNVGFSTTPATSINYQWWLWCTIHHVYITCYQSNYRSNDSSILHHFQSTLIYWRWTILSPGNPC